MQLRRVRTLGRPSKKPLVRLQDSHSCATRFSVPDVPGTRTREQETRIGTCARWRCSQIGEPSEGLAGVASTSIMRLCCARTRNIIHVACESVSETSRKPLEKQSETALFDSRRVTTSPCGKFLQGNRCRKMSLTGCHSCVII